MQISDVIDSDLVDVLALNEASLPHVSSLDMEQTLWFAANAHYFRAARIDELFAAWPFLVR